MGISRFEDLIAWQKARELNSKIHRLTRERSFRFDRDLARQMRAASSSIMSNIAEGFERNRPKEFHQFLSTAKASCGELRSQLYGAFDVGLIEQSQFESSMAKAREVGRLVGGLRAAIERRHFPKEHNADHSALSTQHAALQ